ncbi:hypothetical protein [Pragia fontium]|nr:hypothetical protein [Pragia fontium]
MSPLKALRHTPNGGKSIANLMDSSKVNRRNNKMRKLKVEKYIHDKLDESFMVPVAFIQFLNIAAPNAALSELKQVGFDFQQIITASKQNEPYQTSVEVEEKGIMKRIDISLVQ